MSALIHLYLVHHGEAVGPEVDARRPLSEGGQQAVERLAQQAADRGARPAAIWHSGKLRARQTADAFRRACNPFAEFSAARDLQPADNPEWMRDRLRGETRDVLLAGHFPHLPQLLALALTGRGEAPVDFPAHGVVALASDDQGKTWRQEWQLSI